MFQRTTAINKLLALKKRKKIVQGGTWAGKTYGILPCLINKSILHAREISTVVAESIPAIKQGALSNFLDILHDTQRYNENQYNRTERTYTFKNESTIQFTSFDTLGKAKAAGKRNNLFINEGNYIKFEIADALMMRTSGDIWIDFNPTESFWAHDEILTQEDSEFLLLKASDNEALPETILQELDIKLKKAYYNPYLPYDKRTEKSNIKSDYWHNWCKVYIDGEIGSLEGIIFKDYKVVEEFPKDCKRIVYGLDFGFTNDPTTLERIGLHNGELYFKEEIYKRGLTSSDLNKLMIEKGINRNIPIIADSADPRSIEELRRMGWNIKGAIKGPDSIINGIDALQRYTKNITSDSLHTIEEFRNYKWDVDKETGKSINVPVDTFNHCIDAIRYGCTNLIRIKAGIMWTDSN